MPKSFILALTNVIEETPDTRTLILDQPAVDRIHYLAGQYLTLKVEIDGHAHYRTYSMSSVSGLDDHIAVTVKRVEHGLVSNYIHDHFEAGRLVEFLRPGGRFTFQAGLTEQRHIVLIGAGSGITPLMSILRSALFGEPKSRVSLLYGSRDQEHIIFRQTLEELEKQFPKRFQVQHVLSRSRKELPESYWTGRIDQPKLEKWLAHIQPTEPPPSLFYLCGPEAMMNLAEDTITATGVPPKAIFSERFVATDETTAAQKQIKGPTRWVELLYGDDHYRVQVPPGMTVLQAALAQGISLPFSCKRGICSTCMSRLLQGQVDMENPESLLEFEIQNGKVLTCQAHPTTDDVKILVGG